MKKGQVLRIIDVEGEQVADFITLRDGNPGEYLDCVYTNYVLGRWKWRKGDVIYTNEMRPMWTMVDDTVELHYTGGGYCSRALRTKYKIDNNDGCRETLQAALKANGIEPGLLRECSCFNIFMNVQYQPDGTWSIDRPKSKAGDHIDLRAEMDVLWRFRSAPSRRSTSPSTATAQLRCASRSTRARKFGDVPPIGS
jgi:uncharacterized protein YcgI (DUF1989 family)